MKTSPPCYKDALDASHNAEVPMAAFRVHPVDVGDGYILTRHDQRVPEYTEAYDALDQKWVPFKPNEVNVASTFIERSVMCRLYPAFRRKMPDLGNPKNIIPIERILGSEAIALLRREPKNEIVTGLVRRHARLVLPKELVDEGNPDKLIDWIRMEYTKANLDKVQVEKPTPPDTIIVDVRITEEVSGHQYWVRNDVVSGHIPVPRSVVEEASRDDDPDIIRDWISEHYNDFNLNTNEGDGDWGESHTDESSIVRIDSNIDEVLEQFTDNRDDNDEDERAF